MSWSDLFAAFSVYLVLEGLLPFLSPESWRKTLQVIAGFNDGPLRFFGLASIVVGLGLLLLIR